VFHEELKAAIPLSIGLLGHRDFNIRSAAVSVLGKLAKHGELS
jgi:HEAT repeat protein